MFYENKIRRLISESLSVDRRLKVLCASCVGQPWEMVNLFCASMKSRSTSKQIEKALDRCVKDMAFLGGFTSDPKLRAIRYGPKVSFNSNSLKLFNEDLSLLEVFAYVYHETLWATLRYS